MIYQCCKDPTGDVPQSNRVREPVKTEEGAFQPMDAPTSGVRVAALSAERQECLVEAVHLQGVDLTDEERAQLGSLLKDYEDTFAMEPSELGSTDWVKHIICTGDHPPIRQPPHHIPFALHEKVENLVGEMLEQGVIQLSQSPWASPVVLLAKKDGSTRFCIDYRRLNAVTKLDVFPLPRIDDSDLLSCSKYFSTLDLASGYWQWPWMMTQERRRHL